MKKLMSFIAVILIAITVNAQSIEWKGKFEGGTAVKTSAEKLFSGCLMRMCRYVKDGKVLYGIQLDLTDRAYHVSEGNLFTIHFKDGSRISLSNLWDTKADVQHEEHINTYDNTYTDFVPVYDAWADAVYSVPVTGHYREHVPVHTTTTHASLYYIISPKQIDKVINGEVKEVSIVTDEGTIVKKAHPLSEAMATLYPIVK